MWALNGSDIILFHWSWASLLIFPSRTLAASLFWGMSPSSSKLQNCQIALLHSLCMQSGNFVDAHRHAQLLGILLSHRKGPVYALAPYGYGRVVNCRLPSCQTLTDRSLTLALSPLLQRRLSQPLSASPSSSVFFSSSLSIIDPVMTNQAAGAVNNF